MVVSTIYIRAVQSPELVPDMLKTDHGNETGVMTDAHCTRRQNIDAQRYGTSVANQCIENLCSNFRRTFTSCVVNFFKQMVDKGLLEQGNHLNMQCIWVFFFLICYNLS